jgi:hypothetical protein
MTAPGNALYNEILSTTLSKWLEKNFVDNVFKARVLFFLLTKNDNIRKVDGGAQIVVPVLEADNGTVMTYSQDEELRILRQKGMTAATYDWAQAAVSVTITGIEEAKNRGESKIIDLLEAKTEQAEESFSDFFNKVWFGKSTDTRNVSAMDSNVKWNGLMDFMDSTVTVVGGITGHSAATAVQQTLGTAADVADYTREQGASNSGNLGADFPTSTGGVAQGAPVINTATDPGYGESPAGFWLPYTAGVAAPAGGATGDFDLVLGKRAMRTAYNTVSIGSDQPQVILTTQQVYEQYEDSLVDQIRYTNTEMADAGFQNLMFKATPITYDADQNKTTTHKMDFLNLRYMRLVGHSDTWFKNTPFVRPNNRDARTSQILCYGQFVTLKRSAQARLAWTAA